MMKKYVSVCVVLPFLAISSELSLAGAASQARLVQPAMGTIVEITVSTNKDDQYANEAAKKAFEALKDVERRFSAYIPESELSRLNREAPFADMPVSQEMEELLSICRKVNTVLPKFDPTVGPLIKLWGFYDRGASGKVPSQKEIEAAVQKVGFGNIAVKDSKVRYLKEGITLDAGAVAKGYGVDKAAQVLAGYDINWAIINAGGDIRLVKIPDSKDFWRVGVKNPVDPTDIFAVVKLMADESIVTSGDYENYLDKEGKRYCHIFDPQTGMPMEGVLSVTVVCRQSAAFADALATGFFASGKETAEKVLGQNQLEGVGVLIVYRGIIDKPFIWCSDSIKDRVEILSKNLD